MKKSIEGAGHGGLGRGFGKLSGAEGPNRGVKRRKRNNSRKRGRGNFGGKWSKIKKRGQKGKKKIDKRRPGGRERGVTKGMDGRRQSWKKELWEKESSGPRGADPQKQLEKK